MSGSDADRGGHALMEIVIVNFNAGAALGRCVQSVISQQEPARVAVIDNASTDDSIEQLENMAGRPESLSICKNPENVGFAKAVNQAAGGLDARARYLLILNPDCELQAGALAALRQALEQDSGAALAGPLVVDRQGRPMRGTLRRFPDPWKSLVTFSGLWRLGRWLPAFSGVEASEKLPAGTSQAEAVSGACMLLKKEAFRQVGYMDEAYGLHCEDLDLMFRLRQRGYHCLLVPAARVYHQQGLSSRSRPLWVHWQKHLGMQRFFGKFQAAQYRLPFRWLVYTGIWCRFLLTLPLALFRR